MDLTDTSHSFAALSTPEQFDAILQRSMEQPVVIFKHSIACGTSAQAYDELDSLLHEQPGIDIFLVDVLMNRSLSQAIAARFRIRHESPQILVIRGGEVRWHGSHFRVTAANVRKAMEAASPA